MYLEFYGLKENPFNVTSDPAFLFMSHTHKEALDHLTYGIEQRKGFIEITGEIGAGKTTLCRALLKRLDEKTVTSLMFNPSLPETQLLEAIITDFGITPERRSKGVMLRQLNNFLLTQLSQNNNCILIIDEAQNLKTGALEMIRMLSNLETEKEKLLQIILVGQPQLKTKLDSPALIQLRQRISVRFHVRPLTKEEVPDYIEHRLTVAGSNGSINFTPDAIDAIYNYSSGIPRVINILCDKVLLFGFAKHLMFFDRAIIEQCTREIEGQYSFTAVEKYEHNI